MDLGAYANIDNLESLAKLNGIDVPRLRGYRLMKDEKPMTKEEIDEIVHNNVYGHFGICNQFCCSVPRFTESNMSEFSWRTDAIVKKYCTVDSDGNYVGFRWDLLHGKARKRLKLAIKRKEKSVREQYAAWNRYAGKDDILYIHARIGGNNWNYYKGYLLEKEPWFLEKVDDCSDDTYCDIYAKLENKMN